MDFKKHLMDNKSLLPGQICKFDGYTYKVLTEEHNQAAVQLVAQEFNKKNPLLLASSDYSLEAQRKYWRGLSKELIDSGLSVGCFDQNSELVGVLFSKEARPIPSNKPTTLGKPNIRSALSEAVWHLLDGLPKAYKDILNGKQGKVVQGRGGAVRNQHMGRKIIPMMSYSVEQIALKKGFAFLYGVASNVKSADGFKKLKSTKIAEYDVTQFEYSGERVFKGVSEENRHLSVWLKQIRETLPLRPKL